MTFCLKEQAKQSPYSPCPVTDDETIVYVLLDPTQWKDGQLTASAFSKSSLKKGDLSVCRARYSSANEAEQKIVMPQLQRHPDWMLVGALHATCRDIRAIQAVDPPVRAFCVIDDGLPDYPAHAHLGFSEATTAKGFWGNRNVREAIRANLVDVFRRNGGPHTLEECFAGW